MRNYLRKFKNEPGFTLIELLVVIGILAILLSIVLIAINPARQFGQANDTRRRSDVTAILNAVGAYTADNAGLLPTAITSTSSAVADTGADLCADLVQNYMPALPSDPQAANGGTAIEAADCGSPYDTEYTISRDAGNRVTVTAPLAEQGTISNTR